MVREHSFGKLIGLGLSIEPAFFMGTIVLWVVRWVESPVSCSILLIISRFLSGTKG